MSKLTTIGKDFYMNGEKIQLISGAIHYFRIVPEYWEDRLLKLKACGFNCVETYIPWNLHEPKEGEFNFSGMADFVEFIKIAEKVGLYVIPRPSPYICAEWEFGGLPSWLLADKNMQVRSSYEPFIEKVDKYYDVLIEKFVPLLQTNGGPIIAMQIENEYGSYGNDKKYLNFLKEALIKRGIDVLLFTSDGPGDLMLEGGTVENVLATVNFGSNPTKHFEKLQEHFPNTPNFVMEYWNGWFDHWGKEHHVRDAKDAASTFEEMLQVGASVNFYMFHGGTNFGFYNGANHDGKYGPTITSYDYDCPVSEAGDLTPKYHAVREVLAKYQDIGELVLPAPIPKINYGTVNMNKSVDVFKALEMISTPVQRAHPETMEKLGQDYGFILYRNYLNGPKTGALSILDVSDRALVFVNQKYQGVIDRFENQTLTIEIPEEGAQLDILVENMGRINYGPLLLDPKGITKGVRFEYQFLFDWTIFSLPMDNLEGLKFETNGLENREVPAFYKGTFHVEEIGDTFVELPGWKKGVVFINGFNLGRYWEVGPQKTLYLPGPLLKKGENELIVFELHEHSETTVSLIEEHLLG